VGDRHLKFHEIRDNLPQRGPVTAPRPAASWSLTKLATWWWVAASFGVALEVWAADSETPANTLWRSTCRGVMLLAQELHAGRAPMANVGYVLLCRHSRHVHGQLLHTEPGRRDYPVTAVGERLREELDRQEPPGRSKIKITLARYADSKEARQTLGLLLHAANVDLGFKTEPEPVTETEVKVAPCEQLTTAVDQNPNSLDAFVKNVRETVKVGEAVLLVGHQPQMSRIADRLLIGERRWRIPPVPTPIDHSGVVCIAIDKTKEGKAGWLVWAIQRRDKPAWRRR